MVESYSFVILLMSHILVCLQVPTSRASHEHPMKLEDNDEHREPTLKRAWKRTQKASSPQRKKKKFANAAKVPPVRVSNSDRRNIIVLNVVGLLCNIISLHDRREWGPNLVIHHNSDFNVKIKKKPTATCFCRCYVLSLMSRYGCQLSRA